MHSCTNTGRRTCYAIMVFVVAHALRGSSASAQPDALFTAFQQQCEENCVSIALIKAMMGTYGVANVYERLPTTGPDLAYRLKDGSTVVLTMDELKAAIARTGFKVDPAADPTIRAYADTCFAIMVKRNMSISEYGTFQCALDALNNGYSTACAGPLLGVELEPIKPRRPGRIMHCRNILIHNTYHTVYASDGLYDEANKAGPLRIGALRWKRAGLKTAFGLRGLSGAYRIVERNGARGNGCE